MIKTKENANRSYYLDSVGGILLIHMIIGHCCQWAEVMDYEKYTFWLSFFLPWFFFKAGIFFKIRPIREEIHKSYKRLIIPFIYFSIIGTLILWIKQIINYEFNITEILSQIKIFLIQGSFPGNLALWFLLSLFIVRICVCFLLTKLRNSNRFLDKVLWIGMIIISSSFFLILYFIQYHYDLFYPFWMSNISSGLAFFMLGYLLKSCNVKKLFIPILIIYILLLLYFPTIVDMRSGKVIEGNILLWIPTSLLGILIINNLFKFFFNNKNVLSYIGSQTMPYYCLHWCLILLVSMFFKSITDVNLYLFCLIIVNIIFLPTISIIIEHSKISYIIK